MSQPERSNRFSDAETIELALTDDSVSARVESVRELLRILDAREQVDAHAVFESGVVNMTVLMGVQRDRWSVAFHLVWPEPQLNNQHLNTVKLMNWSAVFAVDFATAAAARRKASRRLRAEIEAAMAPGTGPLEGRIRFVEQAG